MSNLPAIKSVIAGMAWTCSISLTQPLLQVMHTTFALQFKWLETQFLRLIMSKYVFGPGNRASIHSLQTCSPDSLVDGQKAHFSGMGYCSLGALYAPITLVALLKAQGLAAGAPGAFGFERASDHNRDRESRVEGT